MMDLIGGIGLVMLLFLGMAFVVNNSHSRRRRTPRPRIYGTQRITGRLLTRNPWHDRKTGKYTRGPRLYTQYVSEMRANA